jgi:hypothetical protein
MLIYVYGSNKIGSRLTAFSSLMNRVRVLTPNTKEEAELRELSKGGVHRVKLVSTHPLRYLESEYYEFNMNVRREFSICVVTTADSKMAIVGSYRGSCTARQSVLVIVQYRERRGKGRCKSDASPGEPEANYARAMGLDNHFADRNFLC